MTLLGFNINGPKNSLRKQDTKEDLKNQIILLIERNSGIICAAVIVLSLAVFIWICFSVCGLSAVDSGTYYNNFYKVI